jgi:hypothetical protein
MPVQARVIKRTEITKRTGIPTVIRWQGVPMVASHSIRTVAHEIKNMSENQDFVPINFIGKQSTGKTEIMKTIAHLVHQEAKINYQVNLFGRKELLNLEETVKNLTPTNQIIILDDIAFLQANASAAQIKQIESIMAVIRHLPGGKDVRIIMFKSFQYTKALTPFLRQNDGVIISSVDDNEIQNLVDLLGKKYMLKINMLRKLRVQTRIGDAKTSKFVYPLGVKGQHITYRTKDPFLPYLYSNQDSCRIIVSPLRTWIDPICEVCDRKQVNGDSAKNLEECLNDLKEKFKASDDSYNVRTAVRLKLYQHGVNCFKPRVTQILKFLDQYLEKKLFTPEDLAVALDMKPTKTRLDTSKTPEVKKMSVEG